MPTVVTILGLSGLVAAVGAYILRGRGRRQVRQEQPLAAGWVIHAGDGCPVPPLSRPGVKFRSGWTSDVGLRPAESWDDCWTWTKPGALDIVAFEPEPEAPDS